MTDIGKPPPSAEITPEGAYADRRKFIKNSLLFAATAAGVGGGLVWLTGGALAKRARPGSGDALTGSAPGPFSTTEPKTPYADITTYNNFYEFGANKDDPFQLVGSLKTHPWTVSIEGEVHKPQTVDIADLMGWFPLQERVYRMRCVEAWSMVIPWLGFPLGDLLRRVEPHLAGAATSLSQPCSIPRGCRASGGRCSTGPTSKACASTRRCIR